MNTDKKFHRLFWVTVILFGILSTAIPTLIQCNFRGDVLEQIATGRHWAWGTCKHPALPSWIMECFWNITCHANYAPYLASSCCIGICFWSIWKLGRHFLPEDKALLGTLVMTAYWYFNLGNSMYNNNVPLTVFWCVSLLVFYNALMNGNMRYWILLGLFFGMGLLCKYVMGFLMLGMVLYMLWTPSLRVLWRTPGPWVTSFLAILVFMPYLILFMQNPDAMSAYARGKQVSLQVFPLLMLKGLLLQFLIILPILISLIPVITRRSSGILSEMARYKKENHDSVHTSSNLENRIQPVTLHAYLPAMLFFPLGIQLLAQCAALCPFAQRSYGFQIWVLTGLCVLYCLPVRMERKYWKISACLIITFASAEFLSHPIQVYQAVYYGATPNNKLYPGREISAEIDQIWRDKIGEPCKYSCGDFFPRFSYACYSCYQPWLDADHYHYGLWNDNSDVCREGGVLLWEDPARYPGEIPPKWRERFPTAQYVDIIAKRYHQKNPEVPCACVGVAIIHPQNIPVK